MNLRIDQPVRSLTSLPTASAASTIVRRASMENGRSRRRWGSQRRAECSERASTQEAVSPDKGVEENTGRPSLQATRRHRSTEREINDLRWAGCGTGELSVQGTTRHEYADLFLTGQPVLYLHLDV